MQSSFDKLSVATEATKTWTSDMKMSGIVSGNFISNCCVELSGKDTRQIVSPSGMLSLCQFVNSSEYINFSHVNSCFQFDPVKYNSNKKEIRDLLVRDMYESARTAGFPLDHKYRDNAKVFTFTCSHNRGQQQKTEWDENLYQKPGTRRTTLKQVKTSFRRKKGTLLSPTGAPKLPSGHNKHSVRRTTTNRPVSEDVRCPFKLQCFFDDKTSSWYLKHDRNLEVNPNLHIGHNQLRPHLIKSKLIEMSTSERDLAIQCSDLFVQNDVISQLINLRTKNISRFCAKQVQYLRLKLRAHSQVTDVNEGKSSAEALLHNFHDMKDKGLDIHFIALTHSYKDGYLISNSRGRPRKNVCEGECKWRYRIFQLCNLSLNRSSNRITNRL